MKRSSKTTQEIRASQDRTDAAAKLRRVIKGFSVIAGKNFALMVIQDESAEYVVRMISADANHSERIIVLTGGFTRNDLVKLVLDIVMEEFTDATLSDGNVRKLAQATVSSGNRKSLTFSIWQNRIKSLRTHLGAEWPLGITDPTSRDPLW